MSAWQELRDVNRELAFLLLFAPANRRDVAADIMLLATELDKAIHIPSEVMLAAIRVQWWHDALAATENANVPLVQRFQRHYADRLFSPGDITNIIDGWRDRIADDQLPKFKCWAGCWKMLARLFDASEHAQNAGIVGAHLAALQASPEHRVNASLVYNLPDVATAPSWLKMAVYLQCHWHANPTEMPEHPLLIWRMVAWRFGFMPKRPTL